MSRTIPHPPPFKVGQRVRYVRNATVTVEGGTLRPGDVGVVTENQEGLPARRDMGVMDGYSVVAFPGGAVRIVSMEYDGCANDGYEAVK